MDWTTQIVGIVVSSIVSLVFGILIGWHFYRLQIRKTLPLLAFTSRSFVVISPSGGPNEGVEILFKGSVVPRVIRSEVALWNPSGATLDRSDVVAGQPLVLRFGDDDQILQANVVRTTRDAVGFTADPAGDIVRLDFEILDAGDGVLLEVLHTADKVQPRFDGTIKGVPAGPANWGLLDPRGALRKWHDDGGGLGFLVGMISLVILYAGVAERSWIVIVVAGLGVGFPLARTAVRYGRWLERRPPASLLAGLEQLRMVG